MIIVRVSFVLLAMSDATQEAWQIFTKQFYERYLDSMYKLHVITTLEDTRKKNQHWYWSLDRAILYALGMIFSFIELSQYRLWGWIMLMECLSVGLLFIFVHGGWIKRALNNLNPRVYRKRFYANSDGKSDAFFDRIFQDTWPNRFWCAVASFAITALELVIITSQ